MDEYANPKVNQWVESSSIDEIMEYRNTDYFKDKSPLERRENLEKWLIETGRIAP